MKRLAAPRGRARHSRSQRGQSSIEYVVVCAAIGLALGVGMVDDHSVLRQLVEAFKTAYQNYSYALSLPG